MNNYNKLSLGVFLIFFICFNTFVVMANNNVLNYTVNNPINLEAENSLKSSRGFGMSILSTENKSLRIKKDDIDKPINKSGTENSIESTDFTNLEIINRSESSDTYSDGSGNFTSVIYASAINMKDSNGDYRPYEDVTSFSADENEMILEWNEKIVKLTFYTKDENDKKEKISDKSKLERNELKFETNIQKNRGGYYFNHTLDKTQQPQKLGYDIETENVECVIEGYSLICDEQKINFEQAVFEQNLTVEINKDFIEISGDDLSYVDPSITQYASRTDTYCDDMGDTPEYDYHADVLNDIGSDEITGGIEECNGLMQFYVDGFSWQLEQTWQIDSVYLHIRTMNIISEEDNGASIDFCIIDDAEDYDWTPNDQTEIEEDFDRLEECSSVDFLFDYSFEEEEDYTWFSWRIDNLDSEIASEIIDNKDGFPDDVLAIGMEGEYDSDDDERVDFYDEDDGTSAPYIVVNWHLPSPTTSHSATSPPGSGAYSSNTWTKNNVQHYLSCGNECSYVQYCTGLGCTPSGNYGNDEYATISGEGATYFRWRGVYSGASTYYGSTSQYIDKIDKNAPTTTATATSPPGGASYTFEENAYEDVQVSLVCNDNSLSGCKSGYPKYCLDIDNTCVPTITYSSAINISTLGTSYIRYYSKDNVDNTESIKSNIILIDKNYTSNVSMYIDSSKVWEQNGYFTTTETIDDFAQEMNNALSSCEADNDGYCDVPITIQSNHAGGINISNINIYYNTNVGYMWNVSNLSKLSTYKVRVKSTDGYFNSSWDESDGDFAIVQEILPNDTNKFIIQNSSNHTVAWLGDSGNILLSGICTASTNCIAPENSFIIANLTDNTTAYIDLEGNMCIESGDCSDLSASCNPTIDSFVVQNSSGFNVSYIDFDGNLCLTERLYENVEF